MLMQQLADQTERAKIELSGRDSALIAVPFASGPGNLEHFTFEIRREEFEGMIRPLIERTVSLVLQALGESGLGSGGVDALVLAGGSSRIPLVRQMLSAAIGKAAEPRINPEEIVALGAAVEAAAVSGLLPDFKIRDVTSFSLGVEIEGDEFVPLIEKNAPLPLKRARFFTTIGDDQASVEIHVLQGEEGKASRNHSLGRFLLSGIRPGKRGEPRIEVCFELDADDLLHVSARDADTGARQEISIAPERAAGGEGKGELAEKVLSLLGRVRDLKASVAVDRGFEREIEETLGLADIAARDGDEQLLKESRMALETIVGELLAETDKV
jgi:molecular chaperone DnaK